VRRIVLVDEWNVQLTSRDVMCADDAVTVKKLWRSDRTWYSQLENCRWLHIISSCLSVVERVVTLMAVDQQTVVLTGLISDSLLAVLTLNN